MLVRANPGGAEDKFAMDGSAITEEGAFALIESERRLLGQLATGAPLAIVLEDMLRTVEASSPAEMLASILLLDPATGRLRHAAAPSLPADFLAAIDGIASDFPMDDLPDLAAPHGLHPCWSAPIEGADGRMLGVLAAYSREPRTPTPADLAIFGLAARTAALAVERHLADCALRESEARWRGLFERMQEGFFLAEAVRDESGRVADFRLLEVNPAFEILTGIAISDAVGRRIRELVPGFEEEIIAACAVVVDGQAAAQFEASISALAGRWYEVRARNAGRDRFSVLFVEITARKAAEAALRESEERFRLIAENAPVMLWMGDEHGEPLYLNKALRAFWGVSEDVAEFNWRDTLLEESREGVIRVFSQAMARQEPFELEARYWRADGQARTLRTRGEPRRNAEGRFMGMIGVNVDFTSAREAENRQRLLINELNHRVKNTLATVQSLAHQTLRDAKDPRAARDLLTARLLALSDAHDVLTRENWEGAALKEIVSQAIRPYDDSERPRFVVEGPALRVGPRAALALSMALHELATNAVKYGALSEKGGAVAIRWAAVFSPEETILEMEWRESGGPPVVAPLRRGFGSRLLEQGLAVDLGGAAQMSYEVSGLVARIRAPLTPPEDVSAV